MKKRIVKSIAIAALASNSINAHAIGDGFYMGIMMGPATNKAKTINVQASSPLPTAANPAPTLIPANPRSQQFASRLFLGNQFNRFAAIELGFTYFSQIEYKTNPQFLNPVVPGVSAARGASSRVRDIDLMLKGIIAYRVVNIFGKVGVAVTYLTDGPGLNPATYHVLPPGPPPGSPPPPPITYGSTSYKHKFSPTFAFGASYDINQSWEADISATAVLVGGNVNRVLFYGIGISYHFTNKYCGQFLCDD